MSKRKLLRPLCYILSLSFLVVLAAIVGVGAKQGAAQSVTEGYQSDQQLQKGMIVRLKPNDAAKVEAASQSDEVDVLGVVVVPADVSVSLSNTEAQETLVATSGRYEVLVSTQNGTINIGDYIALSSLAGVGMKADSGREVVIGKALQKFEAVGSGSTTTLKTSDGDKKVSLGRIPVEVTVGRNPSYQKDDQAGVPRILKEMAQLVTDQPLSAFRIYAAAAILLISIILVAVLLFAGVRTGMTAIGRNPLAKGVISKNLTRVGLMSLIIFVIGAIAVYLLLRV